MRERHDDAIVGADEACQLVLGLGEAARCDRGPLRLELERLAARKRIELRRTLERDRLEAFLLPERLHLVGLPDEVRRAIDGCDEIRGSRCDVRPTLRLLPEVGRALDVDGLDPTLGSGIDARRRDGMQRALGERREGSDLLDLVAEELDPQRLPSGRGEDVDDAAANGKLAALIDSVDTLVPGARERLRQPLEPRFVPDDEADGLGTNSMRRHPLGQRGRRGAHEPAAGEDVEGARPLADEVRWRLEARRVRDAPTRQKSHRVSPEEPGGSLGGVAGVRVLGQQDEEASSELLVERGQNERQRRLRDTRATGQRLRERLEPFAAGELRDEGVKWCLVHANSGNCVPRAYPSAPLLEDRRDPS